MAATQGTLSREGAVLLSPRACLGTEGPSGARWSGFCPCPPSLTRSSEEDSGVGERRQRRAVQGIQGQRNTGKTQAPERRRWPETLGRLRHLETALGGQLGAREGELHQAPGVAEEPPPPLRVC